MRKAIKWSADTTTDPRTPKSSSFWSGSVGYYIYSALLYAAHWIPSLLPRIENLVINVQYGSTNGIKDAAIDEGHAGLLLNCLYSQSVNEWAIPLERGPEALQRLSSWLLGDEKSSGIPFSSKDLYVHAPIEVRVSDTSFTTPRPYLDNTTPDGPTLYLNATLYRPLGCDPPCRIRYYEAFEWLMKELGGRPHWAKNFSTVSKDEFHQMYPELRQWLKVRDDVDPEGMFVGDWHRRNLLPFAQGDALFPLEEQRASTHMTFGGGLFWTGQMRNSGTRLRAS